MMDGAWSIQFQLNRSHRYELGGVVSESSEVRSQRGKGLKAIVDGLNKGVLGAGAFKCKTRCEEKEAW